MRITIDIPDELLEGVKDVNSYILHALRYSKSMEEMKDIQLSEFGFITNMLMSIKNDISGIQNISTGVPTLNPSFVPSAPSIDLGSALASAMENASEEVIDEISDEDLENFGEDMIAGLLY